VTPLAPVKTIINERLRHAGGETTGKMKKKNGGKSFFFAQTGKTPKTYEKLIKVVCRLFAIPSLQSFKIDVAICFAQSARVITKETFLALSALSTPSENPLRRSKACEEISVFRNAYASS